MSDASREAQQFEGFAYGNPETEYGTVGWGDDPNVLDQATSSDDLSDDGVQLVRVTLYRGKNPGETIRPGRGQGRQILAHVLGPGHSIPPLGKRVLISWPERQPGAPAVILGTIGATAATSWGLGDAAMAAPSGYGNFIRCRSDGRIEIATRTNDGNNADVYSLIDPYGAAGGLAGFYDVAPWGTQIFNSSGWHLQTQWGGAVDFGGWNDGAVLAGYGIASSAVFRFTSITLSSGFVKLGTPVIGVPHQAIAIATGPTGIGLTGLVPLVLQIEALIASIESLAALVATLPTGGSGSSPTTSAAIVSPSAVAALFSSNISALTALAVLFSGAATPPPFASLTTASM